MRKPDWKLWLKDKRECKFWLDSYIRKNILKKSANESRLHLKRTDHNLTFANWIIEKHKDEIPEVFGGDNFYDWVISIYYYAIYDAHESFEKKLAEQIREEAVDFANKIKLLLK